MKLRFPVTVITPSIASKKLEDAVKSVFRQTHTNITHLIVYDGVDNSRYPLPNLGITPKIRTVNLPYNTGKVGDQKFYGHRIYAAFGHLVDTPYVLFLDEDNWFEPDHVDTLVDTLEANPNADFAYSLRNIYDADKQFVCKDNCESLGKWPIWNAPPDNLQYLIDTSSFAFRRSTLVNYGHLWHSGWGGDRRFLALVNPHTKYECSGKYTLNYRLDGNAGSVNADYFIAGNQITAAKHTSKVHAFPSKYPWSGEDITQ